MNKNNFAIPVIMLVIHYLLVIGSSTPASADPMTTINDLDQAYVQIAQGLTFGGAGQLSEDRPRLHFRRLGALSQAISLFSIRRAAPEAISATSAIARDANGIGVHRVTRWTYHDKQPCGQRHEGHQGYPSG